MQHPNRIHQKRNLSKMPFPLLRMHTRRNLSDLPTGLLPDRDHQRMSVLCFKLQNLHLCLSLHAVQRRICQKRKSERLGNSIRNLYRGTVCFHNCDSGAEQNDDRSRHGFVGRSRRVYPNQQCCLKLRGNNRSEGSSIYWD